MSPAIAGRCRCDCGAWRTLYARSLRAVDGTCRIRFWVDDCPCGSPPKSTEYPVVVDSEVRS